MTARPQKLIISAPHCPNEQFGNQVGQAFSLPFPLPRKVFAAQATALRNWGTGRCETIRKTIFTVFCFERLAVRRFAENAILSHLPVSISAPQAYPQQPNFTLRKLGGCPRNCPYIILALFASLLAAQTAPNFDSLAKDADAARDAGKTDKAVDLYQQALHLKPDWRQGWWVLGSILYDANRYQEGAEAFLPLTALDPDKSAGWAMAGLCEFETKHYKDALTHLQKAVQLGLPEALYDVTQYHIELIFIRAGEFDRALEMLSRYAARGADNPKLVEAMGIAALRRPILPQDIPPEEHDFVMAVGQATCDAAANRGQQATHEFETLIAAHPDVPNLHYLYGLVLLQSDSDKALSALQQELILSPKHPQTLISLAAEYVKRSEYATALPYAEMAVEYDPQYFAAHAMLGKVLVEGDLDSPRGVKELEKAVAMAPGNPQSRLALAAAYSKAGRKNDAATQRAEFLRLRTQLDASASGQK